MSTLKKVHKFMGYVMEKHPDLADEFLAADHEKIYLPRPDSDEEYEELVRIGEEMEVFVSYEDDSMIIFV